MLINAAVGLCETQGFDSTTVDQIAAVADVSPRTFSRYFTTKDAVALALLDEVFDAVAVELSVQPLEIGTFEALRRAYVAVLEGTVIAPPGGLTAARLMQIVRIVLSSPSLQQASVEYRASSLNTTLAARLAVAVDDPRVKLVVAVWGAVLRTAVQRIAVDAVNAAMPTVDDVVVALEVTYAEFTGELAAFAQPV